MTGSQDSRKPGVAHVAFADHHPRWTPEELISIFFRLLQAGWRNDDLSDRMAFSYGRSLGRYGLLALAEQDAKVRELAREIVTESAAWGGGQ